MANDCLGSIGACCLRVSRLEADGVPLPGATNLYTSAIIEANLTPEVKKGTVIEQVDGCDNVCLSYQADDVIKWWNVDLTICRPDPELTELLVGGDVLTAGAAVGYEVPALNTVAAPNGVSIELWSKRITSAGDIDSTFPYWRWVFPKVKGLVFGPRKWFNGAFENPFTGGRALENDNWFDGPLNDWTVDSSRAVAYMPVSSIPTAECGYAVLSAS